MSADQARRWLVSFSIWMTGGLTVFLLLAPALGYPLEYSQAFRLLEIVFPTFAGYLGAAAHYITSEKPSARLRQGGDSRRISGAVVRGSSLLFSALMAVVLVAFWLTNRSAALPGAGMDIDLLARLFATLLTLAAGTTGFLVAHLFGVAS